MNLVRDILGNIAKEDTEQEFLTDLDTGKTFSYADLSYSIAQLRSLLAEKALKTGERVAYVTRSNYFYYPLFFACASEGITLVPINGNNNPGEIKAVLNDARPRVVFYDSQLMSSQSGILQDDWLCVDMNTVEHMIPASMCRDMLDKPAEELPRDHEALIIYTSGTTSKAKGIVLTHQNLAAMAANVSSFYNYTAGQRFLCCLPFYHINASMITGLACIKKRSHVFLSQPFGFEIARRYWKVVSDNKINVISLTPSIMASLLKIKSRRDDCDLSSVSFGLVGTAYLEEELWKRFEQTFGISCYQGYGLTETTTWATMTPTDGRKRYDTVGIPVNCQVSISLVNSASGESAGSSRQVGEVLIKGDIVLKEYNNNKSLTRKQLKNGWFHTGDLGFIDEDEQLHIVGRIKNIIKRSGVLVIPEEIDEVLTRHPGVVECCTVGVKHEIMGEQVISACVVRDDGAELNLELRRYLSTSLSKYKIPDSFIFLKSLPRNEMGKISLGELQRIASGEKCREVINRINTLKVCRAKSPDIDQISKVIQECILSGKPIRFAGYWGAGRKPSLTEADRNAFSRLADIIASINEYLDAPHACLELILTDIHARCNEIDLEHSNQYFDEIEAASRELGFETRRLSAIWDEHGIDYENVMSRTGAADSHVEWQAFSMRDMFVRQASRRIVDDRDPEVLARQYFEIIRAENPVITKCYQGCIFFTYNGPEYGQVLPTLPKVYWYSIKKGFTDKPWFVGEIRD